MHIATWNVNSLRVRLAQLLDWLGANRPDIVALQETKLPDAAFPAAEIEAAAYRVMFNGQKTYNGVAILARAPLSETVIEIPSFDDAQRRVLAASCGPVSTSRPRIATYATRRRGSRGAARVVVSIAQRRASHPIAHRSSPALTYGPQLRRPRAAGRPVSNVLKVCAASQVQPSALA